MTDIQPDILHHPGENDPDETETETPVDPPVDADPVDDPLYSTRKVAGMFHLTTETIRNWIKDEKIAGVQIENRWYVRRSEMIRIANQRHGDDS